jgi:hypothetical protein
MLLVRKNGLLGLQMDTLTSFNCQRTENVDWVVPAKSVHFVGNMCLPVRVPFVVFTGKRGYVVCRCI